MSYYQPTAADLANLDSTVATAASKYALLAAGGRTPLLTGLPTDLLEDSGPRGPAEERFGPTRDRFLVQCWSFTGSDAYHGVRYDLDDPALAEAFLARFNSAQATIWAFSDWHLDPAFHAFVLANNFPLVVQLRSKYTWLVNALNSISVSDATGDFSHAGVTWTTRLNYLSGEVLELCAKAMCMETAQLVKNYPSLVAVQLDSEVVVRAIEGDVTDAVAADNDIDDLVLYAPAEGEEISGVIAEDSNDLAGLRFHYQRQNHNVLDKLVKSLIADTWSGLAVEGDTQYNPYEMDGLDQFTSWVGVHGSSRSSGLVPYYIEMMRAKRRFNSNPTMKIFCGPQLGNFYSKAGVRSRRACPPDLYAIGAWLSAAFGADGCSGWGISTIFKTTQDSIGDGASEGGGYYPNGEALWARLLTIRENVFDAMGPLLTSWTPATRRTAIVYSTVNDMYGSGTRDYVSHTPRCTDRPHANFVAFRNMVAAMAYAGEPCDVVFDVEVEDGILDNYETVIVPLLYVANQALIDAFTAYDGVLITHADSILASEVPAALTLTGAYHDQSENTSSIYPDYTPYNGLMTAVQFTEFLVAVADDICSKLASGPYWDLGSRTVFYSRMTCSGKTYHVLVNDTRVAGDEDTWYSGYMASYAVGKFGSTGVGTTLPNNSGKVLLDVLNGELILPGQEIALEAAWGRVFREVTLTAGTSVAVE